MQTKSLQTKRALRAALLVLLLSLAGMGKTMAQNYDFSAVCSTGQTLYYKITDATNHYVSLTCPNDNYYYNPWSGFTKPTGDIVLPEIVHFDGNNYTVVSIGNYAFWSCSDLTGNLIIPNSVTTIGEGAFSGCSGFTGSLTIPNSVTSIGNYVTTTGKGAFSGCSGFTGSLTIPNSVTTIGAAAFAGCSGFTGSLTIPNSVTTIGYGAFCNCSGFSVVYYDATNCVDFSADGPYYLPFSGCGGNLTIGDNVERIPANIFRDGGFTGSLTIGNSVTLIGDNAFKDCIGFNGNLIIGNSVTSIGHGAFAGCSGFTGELVIPNSVTIIEGGNSPYPYRPSAFEGCSGFSSLVLGNSLTKIDNRVFYGCSGFTGNLVIPNSVTSIGYSAFGDCSGLTSITIPNSVTHIGNNAFGGTGWYAQHPDGVLYLSGWCLGYKGVPVGSVVLAGNTKGIADLAFINCGMFPGSLTIPNSVITIGALAFSGCGFNGLNIDMTDIPNSVFKDCDKFTGDLSIGNSVTSIGDNAFQGCSGFTGNLFIGNSVTSIGDNAFKDCIGFNGNLIIGNSVTNIGGSAFEGCSGFSGNLTIPDSVVFIYDYAFLGCEGLTGSLTIPNSVIVIGDKAFSRCMGFTEINFNADNCESCGVSIWSECTGITTIIIGDSVETIEEGLFYGLGNLTTVSLGKSVKYIGEEAFANNPRLNMVYYNVEKDLESDDDVFDNCPNLTTIHIGPEVKEIGSEIFNGCNTVHFVVALGPTPAVLDAGAFSDIVDNSVLMVSCGKRITYYSVWNMFPFNNIIEDCDTYGINVGAVGNGGTITPSVTEAQMGQEVQITITPNPGMALATIKVVNANDPTQIIPISPTGKAASTYSFTMPPFEVVVMATFKSSGASVNENNSIEVAVYPNPTNGLVKIEAESIKHISISNMLGQVVFDGKVDGDAFEYDFSGQKTGVYLVRIETASGVVVNKVSVTR